MRVEWVLVVSVLFFLVSADNSITVSCTDLGSFLQIGVSANGWSFSTSYSSSSCSNFAFNMGVGTMTFPITLSTDCSDYCYGSYSYYDVCTMTITGSSGGSAQSCTYNYPALNFVNFIYNYDSTYYDGQICSCGSGLTILAIVWIVIGCVVGLAIIITIIIFCMIRRRRANALAAAAYVNPSYTITTNTYGPTTGMGREMQAL
ncbi:MAG: hypothetical protein KDD45_09300 [Bdellovibrionales bacterium]|nr:hypothetical protein [Bdellovibrionales bacterium]